MNQTENTLPEINVSADQTFFEPLVKSAQTLFGAAYTPSGRAKLFQAVRERQKKLGLEALTDYWALLRREPAEWARLWPQALSYEGAFLRPAAQFEVARDLLTEWSVMAADRTLRVLSLGCGAGFEIYSLAIMLEETGLRAKNWQVEIYGLDLNEEAIRAARAAVFSSADLEWLSEVQRKKWFTPRLGGFHFKTNLVAPIRMAAANIYEPEAWPWAGEEVVFDLIFCRGLTFQAPPKAPRQLARIIRQNLSESGFIFTAPGEFLPLAASDLYLEERDGVTYYRRGIRRIKVNRHHQTRKEKAGHKTGPESGDLNALSPLGLREKSLLDMSEKELAEGRLEAARTLADEVMLSLMDQSRPAPEAWRLVARIEEALGRVDLAKATEEVLTTLG